MVLHKIKKRYSKENGGICKMKAKHILSKPGEFTTVTKIENGMVTLSKNIEGSELKGQITLQEFYRLYDIVEYIK